MRSDVAPRGRVVKREREKACTRGEGKAAKKKKRAKATKKNTATPTQQHNLAKGALPGARGYIADGHHVASGETVV